MTRIHIRSIRLRNWFPPNDAFATAIAKLCMLREDFLLELYGIVADRIEKLDDASEGYRRTYFWRNSLRTLEEIRITLNRLSGNASFKAALSIEPQAVQGSFNSLRDQMNKASDELLRDLRNTIAAHLDEAAVQGALDEMDVGREGLIEVGEILGKTHYKFAGELLAGILLKGVPMTEQQAVLEAKLGKSSSLIRAVSAIDNVIECYFRDRHLP